MRKLGYMLHEGDGSELIWNGERCEPDLESGIDTYEDHRMALAFAPAALRIKGLKINSPHVVSKSYPRFWDDLRNAGFVITESAENP
jgi:3-phosphoshikimate 1-carboxyvinyltransferase